jgi:hypothetical protein
MHTGGMSAYDGEHRTHTLIDGTVIDLYWSRSLGKYVTLPGR